MSVPRSSSVLLPVALKTLEYPATLLLLLLFCRASKNLLEFSKRAHFLKGSSGQLGVQRLQATCSTLQHYGELWDPSTSSEKTRNLSEQEATERIKPLVKRARGEYKEARRWLNDYLRSRGAQVEEEKEEEEDKDEKEDEKEKETKAAPTPATPAVAAAKPTGAQAAPKTEQPKVKEPEKAKPNGMKAPASPKVARKEKA